MGNIEYPLPILSLGKPCKNEPVGKYSILYLDIQYGILVSICCYYVIFIKIDIYPPVHRKHNDPRIKYYAV